MLCTSSLLSNVGQIQLIDPNCMFLVKNIIVLPKKPGIRSLQVHTKDAHMAYLI